MRVNPSDINDLKPTEPRQWLQIDKMYFVKGHKSTEVNLKPSLSLSRRWGEVIQDSTRGSQYTTSSLGPELISRDAAQSSVGWTQPFLCWLGLSWPCVALQRSVLQLRLVQIFSGAHAHLGTWGHSSGCGGCSVLCCGVLQLLILGQLILWWRALLWEVWRGGKIKPWGPAERRNKERRHAYISTVTNWESHYGCLQSDWFVLVKQIFECRQKIINFPS